ncbi:MAG: hypothetical protein LBL58_06315 [Tannerellaceae bacterium]|nr:hypothetical protein [Tannerellaceae bacterium]
MAVYNENSSTSNQLKGNGFYMWTGNQWCIAQQTSCQGTPSIGTISVSSTDIPVNVVFQALVDSSVEAVQYIWTVSGSANLVGYSNTNVIRFVIRWKDNEYLYCASCRQVHAEYTDKS